MANKLTGKPYVIKKWATIKLADANLDARTLKYIELITQEEGQVALDKYLKWTGWYEVGLGTNALRKQTPIAHRLFRAAMLASTVRMK